jgi:histidinol phosphatase-like PHP family hydrolase
LLLSGYRAFKIAEKYPFFIVDEISFMDPERLKEFINHIKETAQTIILTTIPGREIDLPGMTHIHLAQVRR